MFAFSLLPVLAGAQLGPARVADVDESVFQGCVDAPEPLVYWGRDVSCPDWAAEYDAVGHCNVQDLELPPDCDIVCQAWFRDGNVLAAQCPDTCGYCGDTAQVASLLEPAANVAAESAHPGAIGHFVIEGDYFCLQGPLRHQVFMLALLKSGSFGALHSSNTVHLGPCSVSDHPNINFMEGHDHPIDTGDHCYPPAQLYHRTNWVEIEPYGMLPVGDLMESMDVEHAVANEWVEQSSWGFRGDDDMGVWPSLTCFCLEHSDELQQDPHITEENCEMWSHDDRPASFVTDDGLSCVESHMRYANRALAALRSSSLARLYVNTRLQGRTCAERGFTEAAEDHPCYPGATRYFESADGPEAVAANEQDALEAYGSEHEATLAGHSPEAVRGCSCLPGSPGRDGLSDDECDAPELQSPVLQYWPLGAR